MNNYIQPGEKVDITAPYAASAGGGVLVGTALFGIAVDTVASNAAGEIACKGVYDIAKATGYTFAAGDRVWWDNTLKIATTSSTAAPLEIGVALSTAATATLVARTRLHEKI